jgi:hypothetical protein
LGSYFAVSVSLTVHDPCSIEPDRI